MSWQEDLHRLEHDLAMGRLSAEDYRRQRDELLAAANAGQAFQNPPPANQQGTPPGGFPGTPPGGFPGAQPTGTPPGGFPGAQPTGTPPGGFPGAQPTNTPPGGFPGQQPTGTPPGGIPGQQQTPFPPAFKWAAQPPTTPPPPSMSESTQTIRPVGPGPAPGAADPAEPPASADATQVVHNSGRPGDGERTQVVHNNPYGQPQGQQGQQQWRGADQSGLYSSGQMDNMPNWNTGGAFGDWPKQGPEVFESSGSGKGGKRALLIALIVVVVAGLGVGGWFLFGNKSHSSNQAGSGASATRTVTPTTSQGPRPAIGPLVYPPGNPDSQEFTPAQLTEQKPLAKPDLDILGNTSLSKAQYVVSRDGTTVLDLWAFTVQDEASAKKLAASFDSDQGRFGFQATDIRTSDGQYTAEMSQQQSGDQNVVAYRLHYVVGNQVIRVEAFDPSEAKAQSEFTKLLALQTELTPPSKS